MLTTRRSTSKRRERDGKAMPSKAPVTTLRLSRSSAPEYLRGAKLQPRGACPATSASKPRSHRARRGRSGERTWTPSKRPQCADGGATPGSRATRDGVRISIIDNSSATSAESSRKAEKHLEAIPSGAAEAKRGEKIKRKLQNEESAQRSLASRRKKNHCHKLMINIFGSKIDGEGPSCR